MLTKEKRMIEAIPFINLLMQYLIVPAFVWVWILHKGYGELKTDMAVVKAEAVARDNARREEREAFGKQLDQILTAIQSLNGRIDTMMKDHK